MAVTKSSPLYLLLLIILIISGGIYSFGFSFYWIAIPTPFVNLNESFVILLALLFMASRKRSKIVFTKTVIKYYWLFFVWILIVLFKNILFFEVNLAEGIQKFTVNYLILLIFPIVKLIENIEILNRLFKTIIWLGLITCIVYIYQFLSGISLAASSAGDSYGVQRINNPGMVLIALSIMLIVGKVLEDANFRKHMSLYFIGILCLAISLLTISRGFIFGIIGGVMFAFLINAINKKSFSIIFRLIFITFFSVIFFGFIYGALKFNTDFLFSRMEEGVEEMYEGSGSYNTRTEMIKEKINVIAEEKPLTGIGFAYYTTDDKDERQTVGYYLHPYALNGDSTIQNIMIIGGYPAIVFWVLLNIYPIFFGVRKYKKSSIKEYRAIYLALSAAGIFIILHSFSSNYFSTAGFLMLSLTTGGLFLADKFEQAVYRNN